MEQLIDFHAPEVQAVLDTLLKDKSTGKNIIWATDPPEELQTVMYEPVTDRSQITTQQLGLTHYEVVLPRMMKQTDTQQQRTRKKGEVFSPAWVCNKMNNALDADWFRGLGAEESAGQFTVELPQGWQTVETPVQFPACGGKTPAWVQYVQSRRLEVTCGEAPFLASRYDAATGEMIPVARRIGILDRKLRVVSENAATEDEWRKYATHAVQSTYGYEYQGDNLLLARVNLLLTYGRDLKLSDQKRFESTAKAKMDVVVNKVVDNYRIDQSQLETQRTQQLQSCTTAQQRQQVNREFDAKQQQSTAALMETLQSTIQQTAQEMQQTIVRTVETNQKEQEKKGYEDTVRDHLRGFSRTIPSFLMAYGDETVTLANFDQIIPDKVFQEVTSITLEQFRFLRDGGPYINQATGQEEHFAGHLFDPVVFDDSVKEFLNLKVKLADYFDESRTEDIFDYIPPQKTNQIFTPKWVVKKMVDLLEQENPGCFDDPGKTFLDPYMKSGLYITEIVKRLYRSEKMRQAFPDDNARLEHIFAKQVYGLAPTEIIYRIAISYILGFAKGHGITAHHIRQADTLEFAKAGTMEREMDKIFRD